MGNTNANESSNRISVKMSLRKKLLLSTLPLVGLTLIAMMAVNYYQAVSSNTKTTEQYVAEIADKSAISISQKLDQIKTQLEWIAERNDVKSMNWSAMEEYINIRAFNDRNTYSMLFVIEPDGSYYIAGKGKSDHNLSERAYVKDIFELDKSFSMTNPDFSKSTNEMKYTLAVPINREGIIVGILAANVSLNALCDITNSIKIGENGYVFAIDGTTNIIAHQNKDFLLNFNLLDSTLTDYKGLNIAARRIMTGERIKEYVEKPDGDDYLIMNFPIDGTPNWKMIAAIPKSDITAGANQMFAGMMVFFIILCIIIVSVISISINKLISKPIRKFYFTINEIANGFFHQTFDYKADDEIGEMSTKLQEMCTKLIEIAEAVKTGANTLAVESEQVHSTSQMLSNGSNEQAASIEELSATMEEMAGNISQNTHNAEMTNSVSNEAFQKFNEVVKDLQNVFNSNRDIAERIMVINDIAQETNILALNASVEAARAGEYGKGFSIVANEVRKLAENSKIAADQIIELSTSGLKVSELANIVMNETLPKIQSTNSLVSEIVAASVEQNVGAGQINIAIQKLNNVVRSNASSSEELAASAEELAEQAQRLKETVEFFK